MSKTQFHELTLLRKGVGNRRSGLRDETTRNHNFTQITANDEEVAIQGLLRIILLLAISAVLLNQKS
jgi:hypothetical protein